MLKTLLFLIVFLFSRPLFACTVCFGGADSNLVRGFTWGVGLLLTLPFLLIGCLGGLIVYTARKNKNHAQIRP